MTRDEHESHAENFSLRDLFQMGKGLTLTERASLVTSYYNTLVRQHEILYMRVVNSAADREVEVIDPISGNPKRMLMFGSNNYLGLANHPYVREQVERAVSTYGIGLGGPPLLNGYTRLHQALEERLSAFKHAEDTILFSSGYGANIGLLTAILNKNDTILFDRLSHASFYDGMKMSGVASVRFAHNDIDELTSLLDVHRPGAGKDTFVGVEGVYSMDGDLAPLDRIVPLCKTNGAILIVDDAHGTGVMGNHGAGTVEHFGMEGNVDIIMGTFSKSFGAVGGFVSASRPITNYLRYFARSYMFSASLPPIVIAAILAALDVIENHPELRLQLLENVSLAATKLQKLGFPANPQAAIITLLVPQGVNIRKAALKFHELGIFINSIEYPAVPLKEQRFRISLMATHTTEDIDRLVSSVEEVWAGFASGN